MCPFVKDVMQYLNSANNNQVIPANSDDWVQLPLSSSTTPTSYEKINYQLKQDLRRQLLLDLRFDRIEIEQEYQQQFQAATWPKIRVLCSVTVGLVILRFIGSLLLATSGQTGLQLQWFFVNFIAVCLSLVMIAVLSKYFENEDCQKRAGLENFQLQASQQLLQYNQTSSAKWGFPHRETDARNGDGYSGDSNEQQFFRENRENNVHHNNGNGRVVGNSFNLMIQDFDELWKQLNYVSLQVELLCDKVLVFLREYFDKQEEIIQRIEQELSVRLEKLVQPLLQQLQQQQQQQVPKQIETNFLQRNSNIKKVENIADKENKIGLFKYVHPRLEYIYRHVIKELAYCNQVMIVQIIQKISLAIMLYSIMMQSVSDTGWVLNSLRYFTLSSGATLWLLHPTTYRPNLHSKIIVLVMSSLLQMFQQTPKYHHSSTEIYNTIFKYIMYAFGIPLTMDKEWFCVIQMGIIGFWSFFVPSVAICSIHAYARDNFTQNSQFSRQETVRGARAIQRHLHWIVLYFLLQLTIIHTFKSWILRRSC
eukprot:TRINITY_DN3775_c0_g1_i1.p1 TRINITY_DN3775_c0_g1~~TRINITY_DN3775_c0_g1_i1.p1  ORF type:complete len:549 (+),score=37.85 TRINITY_DN3775_c0_g1_i1:44-1648(+)